MYYNFTRRELKEKNGTDFKENDTINIADSHFEINIKYGTYKTPNMHSTVYDVDKGKYQDIVFRSVYVNEFLRR